MSSSNAASLTSPRYDNSYLRGKKLKSILAILGIAIIAALASSYSNFDVVYAISSIPLAFSWLFTNFMPSADSLSELPEILTQTWSTILSAVASTTLASLFAIIVGVLGSNVVGISSITCRMLLRVLASIFRNIPIVAWALILLLSFKQGEFTGFLALFLSTFGQLARLFLDTFDEISVGPVEALRATGASYWHIVCQAAIPLAITQLMSWILYMVETNIRSATLVGMLTGSGIGFIFDVYYKNFRYDSAGLVVLVTIIAVVIIELISNRVRRSML